MTLSCSAEILTVISKDFDKSDRLRMANLKLHMKKCSLFQRKVNFLGHVLTESGIEVQKDKVEAIQNWPRPRTLTELRSFVRITGDLFQNLLA